MKRAWKQGDVALVNGEVMLRRSDGRWEHGDELRFPVNSTEASPLLVIDPESREQVERLLVASWKECGSQKRASNLDVDNAQDALRSLLAPPKPSEPERLAALVEDANGVKYVSVADPLDGWMARRRWLRIGGEINATLNFGWSELDVVRVLSDGWVEES